MTCDHDLIAKIRSYKRKNMETEELAQLDKHTSDWNHYIDRMVEEDADIAKALMVVIDSAFPDLYPEVKQ